jgi:pimeloyl-ACP methyl ester carboxylesterase
MPPQTRYAPCGDLSIAYQVIGDGPRDLIIVPGWLWHIELYWNDPGYHRFMQGLTDFARVIAYDKRGTALSDPVPAAPSLDERMDDVRAVLDAVGSERATVFGISEGGSIGALFAATHPDRTEALILYGAPVCGLQEGAPAAERWGALLKHIRGTIDRWGEGETLGWGAPSIDSPVGRRATGLVERAAMSPAMARANCVANIDRVDVRPILPSVSVPTLVLHRRDDPIPIEHGRYYAEHIPDARLVELEGVDHWPFVGDVDAIIGEIEEFLTGSRAARASDRVLATVLFTDIVESTERAVELGDSAWRALLQGHDDLVRRQLIAHGGREIKQTGDGFLSTFDSPARAVRCASRIAAETGELGIGVRAGLHTGECEQRGDDIGGLAVHIGARISGLAAPGEVLVSGTVHDLVLGSGIDFSDRGIHALKGVPGDWHLFAVADTAMPVSLPNGGGTRASVTERAALGTFRRVPALGRAITRIRRKRLAAREGSQGS